MASGVHDHNAVFISDRARLAVGVIVKDAADLLTNTLKCALQLADQVVVVDCGSQDGSLTIARKLAHTVISFTWDDSFSQARNCALEAMSADWALWLDAGETIDPADAASLRAFVDAQADSRCLYYLNVRIPPPFPGASSEQVARMRLCPVRPGLRFTGRLNEQIDETELRPEELPWVIHRGSREHMQEVRSHRATRNLRIAQRELSEIGPKARLLNAMGEAYLTLGEKIQAAASFEEAAKIAEPMSLDLLEAYYGRLTTCEDDVTGREKKIELCLDALEVFPLDAQLLCTLGTFMQSAGRLELAARSFRAAVEHGQIRPAAWHLANLAEVSAICLANCLQGMGQENEALKTLRDTLLQSPASERLRRRLLDMLLARGERDEALEVVEGLVSEHNSKDVLRSVVRGACLCKEERWISALAYLQTAYLAGCKDPLCCKWLCTALIASGSYAAARGVLLEWQGNESASQECEQMLVLVQEKLAQNGEEAASGSQAPEGESSGERIVRVHEQTTLPKPKVTSPITEWSKK